MKDEIGAQPVEHEGHARTFSPQHLRPALAALLSLLMGCGVIEGVVRWRLRGAMDQFAQTMAPVKLTGNALQTAAFRTPGYLPVYGSSELDRPAENRPDLFFLRRPTGFEAFPIGKAGNTCLIILEKLAAAGDSIRGKKVAVLLSPTWFLHDASASAVASNLRPLQVGTWLFNLRLSVTLRQDIARRLVAYPRALKTQPLLATTLADLAGGSAWGRVRLIGLTPVGLLQNFLLERMEYWALLKDLPLGLHTRRQKMLADRRAKFILPTDAPDWDRLAAKAEAHDRALGDSSPFSVGSATLDVRHSIGQVPQPEIDAADPEEIRNPSGEKDADFYHKLGQSREWADLALMLRVLRELNADALIISQPFNGVYRNLGGNTPTARRAFYDRLTATVQAAGFATVDFSEHEADRTFFNDSGHPSAKAWIFYDHALDDFYHDRLDGKRSLGAIR